MPHVATRVLAVINPHASAGFAAAAWPAIAAALRGRGASLETIETRGDGRDIDRIAAAIAAGRPGIVLGAGGDGTLSAVATAMMRCPLPTAAALAILPLGTANNVARSLGLLSCRQAGDRGIEVALAATLQGRTQPMDVGEVRLDDAAHYFVGSFAIGMDADILVTRNRYHQRLGSAVGGYPLYLWSCAVNLLRRHSTTARLQIDGVERTVRTYNLLITNTALYAGEFRFDAASVSDDGYVDLQVFTGPLPYVQGFVAAWRRHLRFLRGRAVQPPQGLLRVRAVDIALAAPVACQLDGEEAGATQACAVRVLPRALGVRVL